jgi:exopolyphosphatase / guanosine-5'-triphosphate,3'-diphosphate pyrophosphatase
MRVAVIDVGSNTMRLLVAAPAPAGVEAVFVDRAAVGLAEAIEERGWIPGEKVDEASAVARRFAGRARALDSGVIEVVVTAPGRQAVNADDLLVALQRSTGVVPRVLSAETEGRLAFAGAAVSWQGDGPVAVCDVGGGSTEVAIGDPDAAEPSVASFDIGSLRLTARLLDRDAPGAAAVDDARLAVRELLEPLDAFDRPAGALAVGGSARALRKLVGDRLDRDGLDQAIDLLARRSALKVARRNGIGERRSRTLLAGAVIIAEVQRRLGRPFAVAPGGLREGLSAELLARRAAA